MQSNGVTVNNLLLLLLLLKVDREMTSYSGERQGKENEVGRAEGEETGSQQGERANIFIGKHKLQSFLYTPDL